jgi:hypothetical protein
MKLLDATTVASGIVVLDPTPLFNLHRGRFSSRRRRALEDAGVPHSHLSPLHDKGH